MGLLIATVFVVTATAGYRHDSIPTAEGVIASACQARQVECTFLRTEDEVAQQLTTERLAPVNAVLFVNTTGDLPAEAGEAVVAWVRSGGTFAGFHSASDTWHGMPAYLEMLGGEFLSHPPEMTAEVFADEPRNAVTRNLPDRYSLFDEFYDLAIAHPEELHVVLSLHDPVYAPLAWEKRFGNGRVFYTALGHRSDVWLSPWYQQQVSAVLDWAIPPSRRRAAGR